MDVCMGFQSTKLQDLKGRASHDIAWVYIRPQCAHPFPGISDVTCILAKARSCFSFQNAMRSSKGIYTLHIAEVAEVQRKQQSHAVA